MAGKSYLMEVNKSIDSVFAEAVDEGVHCVEIGFIRRLRSRDYSRPHHSCYKMVRLGSK